MKISGYVVHSEGTYEAFKRSGKKPNTFCKENLKMGRVKSYAFVKDYFKDVNKHLEAIHEYRRNAKIRKGENTLEDLLR